MATGASSTRIALAARYASSVRWNSRCSLVMVVTIPTLNRQLRTRAWASPCDVASRSTQSLPPSTMSASRPWSSMASGVVVRLVDAVWTSPTRVSTVPTRPGCMPASSSMPRARNEVVDFPSVPVMPYTRSCSEGRPNHASAASATACRALATISCGMARSGVSRSATTAVAPAVAASGMKSHPSWTWPGMAKKTDPGETSALFVVSPRTSPVGMPITCSGPMASASAPRPIRRSVTARLAACGGEGGRRRPARGRRGGRSRSPSSRPTSPRDLQIPV